MAQSFAKGTVLREYVIVHLLSIEKDSFVYFAETGPRKQPVIIKEHFPVRLCERDLETGEIFCRTDEDVIAFDESLKEFENITLALSRLDHPGVPRQLRLFAENGTLYRVSSYTTGYSLPTLLKRKDKDCGWFFDEEELRNFLWRVLEILRYIHENGVCHCDLKPRHISLTRLGNPLLTHFCSNRELNDERLYSSREQDAYLSPEQWIGGDSCNPATDIYSTGAIFYRILTGMDPVSADSRRKEDTLEKLADNKELRKNYTKPFLQWIDKAMSLDRKERFVSAEEWQTLLWKQRKFSKPFWVHGVVRTFRWKKYLWSLVALMVFCGGVWGAYLWLQDILEVPHPEPVVELATELSTKGHDSQSGRLWGFSFAFRDYGFGVSSRSLPPVVSLSSISFEGTQIHPQQAAPPVYLSIRTEDGQPLALSKNSASFSKPGKVDFTFDEKVVLGTTKQYQYIFVTEKGAAVMVDLKTTRRNPLSPEKSEAFGYNLRLPGAVPGKYTIPSFTVRFSPNSGAAPLTEAMESAQMAQSRGYADPRNWCLHPGVSAQQSSTLKDADASRAIDGQMSGEMGILTDPAKGNGWWLVSFGKGVERPVQKVIIYNMQEMGALESRRLSDFRVTLFDRKGQPVVSKDFYTEPGTWLRDIAEVWDLDRPYFAHSLRVEKLGKGAHPEDAALFLAEVEVIAPDELTSGEKPAWKDWCREEGVKASQSGIWRNWVSTYGPHRAVDAHNDARYFIHTVPDNTPGWWEVDLGASRPVTCIELENRLLFGYDALRLSNYRISLFDEKGDVVLQREFYTTPGDYAPDFVFWKLPEVQNVRKVRVEKLGKGTHPYDNALSLKKVHVYGMESAEKQ